jgi:hypothetical protein
MYYTQLFWFGTIVFLVASIGFACRAKYLDWTFVAQFLGGIAMFVGSKIGRSFLGLE